MKKVDLEKLNTRRAFVALRIVSLYIILPTSLYGIDLHKRDKIPPWSHVLSEGQPSVVDSEMQ